MQSVFLNFINKISELFIKLVYVNLLWISFSLLGLIIFGLFPATVSMFAVIRKMVLGDEDLKVFPLFWHTYKNDFLRSNWLGFVLVFIGAFLYVDLQLLSEMTGMFSQFLTSTIFVIIFIYSLMILYIFPVFVHYDISLFQTFKQSFLFMIISPKATFIMIGGIITLYVLVNYLSGLIPFVGASMFAFVIMWAANLAFTDLQRRKEKLANT